MIAAAPFILQNLSAVLLLIVSVLVVVLITVFLIAHGKSAFRVFLQGCALQGVL